MSLASAALVAPTKRPMGRVHVIGAGPVGLFLTALLQSIDGQPVRLYERRDEYTRTRMVSLAEYLIADSIESYKADTIDGQSVEAIFDPVELETRLAYRRTLAAGPAGAARGVDARVRPAEHDRAHAQRADRRPRHRDRRAGHGRGRRRRGARAARARRHPRRLHRLAVAACATCSSPAATTRRTWPEHRRGSGSSTRWSSRSCTASTTRATSSASTTRTSRTPTTSSSRPCTAPATTAAISHVTGIVEHQQGRVRGDAADVRRRRGCASTSRTSRRRWTGSSTRSRPRPTASSSATSRSPASRSTSTTPGTRRAGAGTSPALDHPLAAAPVFLLGDSAIGSPYFQSISLGLECAFFLAGHIGNRALPDRRRSSTATRRSCTSSGCGSTCGPR